MNELQPLSAKLGEVRFRQKLVKQHEGKSTFYPTHTNAPENFNLLKRRAKASAKIFRELKRRGISLSPFLELGGEKCERAAVLTSKMGQDGAVVDLSAESLQSASQFCPQLGLKKLPLRICADAYHLPFPNNSLVFIFTFQTLHHFPNPTPIIKEIYRVLSPGGYFYFDEEPVKQTFNIPLWRRDYHLRWWEKILKIFLILPFISIIGRSEVLEGVLEETFDLPAWEKALGPFTEVEVELVPFPFGPVSKIRKNGKHWLKPNLLTGTLIKLTGGGIRALCRKKGRLKTTKQPIATFLACPECGREIKETAHQFVCPDCKQKYPVRNGVLYLLPKDLKAKLYP